MQERSVLISNVLIMIGGAAGNAATITISHLLYHYREASNSFTAACLGENIISCDGGPDLPRPKAKSCVEINNIIAAETLILLTF